MIFLEVGLFAAMGMFGVFLLAIGICLVFAGAALINAIRRRNKHR